MRYGLKSRGESESLDMQPLPAFLNQDSAEVSPTDKGLSDCPLNSPKDSTTSVLFSKHKSEIPLSLAVDALVH